MPIPGRLFNASMLVAVAMGPGAASAEPTTPGGAISVAQVNQMLDQAPTNGIARQVLTAYLAGVGETVGVMIATGGGATCQQPFSLTAQDVRAALGTAGNGLQAGAVAATPLIVHDMLNRAQCSRRQGD
ncbi:MAG: hypothetical protein PW843_17535 [Azospirillaceae bacterium]|nr:hypothetical protein [Azospirillaceae bacterium]